MCGRNRIIWGDTYKLNDPRHEKGSYAICHQRSSSLACAPANATMCLHFKVYEVLARPRLRYVRTRSVSQHLCLLHCFRLTQVGRNLKVLSHICCLVIIERWSILARYCAVGGNQWVNLTYPLWRPPNKFTYAVNWD